MRFILYPITRITTKFFVYSLKQEENRQTIKNVYDVYEAIVREEWTVGTMDNRDLDISQVNEEEEKMEQE